MTAMGETREAFAKCVYFHRGRVCSNKQIRGQIMSGVICGNQSCWLHTEVDDGPARFLSTCSGEPQTKLPEVDEP